VSPGLRPTLGVLVTLFLAACTRTPPDQPVPVVWDRTTCAHCHMLLSEPRHAAEIVGAQGDVWFFDDPGCLFGWQADNQPAIHRMWFHGEGEAWLASSEVAFVRGGPTPMGSGLVAVPAGTPGAMSLEAARAAASAVEEMR